MSAPLAVEVTFAAVAEQQHTECATDDPDAFEMPASDDGDPVRCIIIDSTSQLSVSDGEVEFVRTDGDGQPIESLVALTLEQSDAESFGELTSLLVDQPQPDNLLAIIVENEIESVPAVMTPITDGVLHISAGEDAESLYNRLTGESAG